MKINKSLKYFIFLLLCSFPMFVYAKSYYGVITGAGVRVRKDPSSTNYYKMASSGEIFNMPDAELLPGNSDCQNGWYKVNYNESSIGYVCSNYIKVYEKAESTIDGGTPSNDCEREMQQKGFPSSYWSGLCSLKSSHSNWDFVAMTTDTTGNTIDWNMSVNAESSCGKNYISTSNAAYKDSGCTKTGDSGYYPVSTSAVKYYMDPRNFLNEVNIFMFESQNRNDSVNQESYKTASSKIFGNSYLIQQIPNLTEYIKNASNETGVSQTAIASRIKQELGNAKLGYTYPVDGSALYSVVSGNYTTRTGWTYNGVSVDNYYNFFNIAAYDGSDVTKQALIYALNHKWGGTGNQDVDRQAAVTGGSQFLNNKYVGMGQNTAYYQKFNIFPSVTTSRYLNQYMTNIQAPVSESKILYNAYKDAGILDSSFKFYIPVYQGMDSTPTSVEDVENNSNTNNNPTQKSSVESIVNSAGFRYSNGYISKINIGTNVDDIKNALASVGGSVSITDASGKEVSGVAVGTGYRINISGATNETLIAVVYGDVSGDGKINALDLLKVQKQILGTANLNGSYKEAADVSHDGNINALDLLKVQKNILNTGNIEQ